MISTSVLRFRVQTAPPLEPWKAWHSVDLASDISRVGDLVADIALALGLGVDARHLSLELDGFALLPTSPVGVVRDGDLITLHYRIQLEKRKAVEGSQSELGPDFQTQKRQKTRSSSPVGSSALHTRPSKPLPPNPSKNLPAKSAPSAQGGKPRPLLNPDATSSDSSESTDSDSSSEDDPNSVSDSSDSDSSSDSSSNSSSDSDSDAPPKPQPIKRRPVVSVPTPPKPNLVTSQNSKSKSPSQPLVPPGQGKRSTKDRNARRRKLQKHRAAGTATVPYRSQSATPAVVTTVSESTSKAITRSTPAPPIAPAKSANKNKRRGFDQDMATQTATRTIFEESTTSAPAVPDPLVPAAQARSRYTHYHLVPPSQLPSLPANVVVTSVDVEGVDGMDGVGDWFDGEAGVRAADADQPMQDAQPGTTQKIDWGVVDGEWEKRWDSLPFVGAGSWQGLKVGAVLGWKDLMIDPATFTPAMKIHLARVIAAPDLGSNQVQCFFIDRPGASDVGFGFGGRFSGGYADEEGAEDEETGESRLVAAGEIEGWKVVA